MPLLANINVGSAPNDGTGANLRSAFTTVNENFQFVEAFFPNTSNIALTANIDSTGTSTFNNVTVSNLTVTNSIVATIANAGLASFVTGNAQANITSVGTLTGLTLSGGLVGTTISAATIGNSGASLVGTIGTASQTNITSLGTLTGLTLSGTLTGTSVEAATIGNTGASLTGTILTSFQPNITTVGSLSNLTMNANSFIAAANITITRVSSLLRAVNRNLTSNSTSFSLPFDTNTAIQFHTFSINTNCTVSYTGTIYSGIQHFVTVKNQSASTANIILPNANNNKASTVVPIATNAVATIILTSFDTTSGNVVGTITNT